MRARPSASWFVCKLTYVSEFQSTILQTIYLLLLCCTRTLTTYYNLRASGRAGERAAVTFDRLQHRHQIINTELCTKTTHRYNGISIIMQARLYKRHYFADRLRHLSIFLFFYFPAVQISKALLQYRVEQRTRYLII